MIEIEVTEYSKCR